MKGLPKEHTCIAHGHRQCGDDLKEEGVEVEWRWAKLGDGGEGKPGNGKICKCQ